MDTSEPEQIVWQGRYVVAKVRGRWEYVSRARNIRAADDVNELPDRLIEV